MATTQVCPLTFAISRIPRVLIWLFSRAAPPALRLGWGTLHPPDLCPEVYLGLGCLQNTLPLVV